MLGLCGTAPGLCMQGPHISGACITVWMYVCRRQLCIVAHVSRRGGFVVWRAYLLAVAVLHKNISRVARLRPAEEARDEFSSRHSLLLESMAVETQLAINREVKRREECGMGERYGQDLVCFFWIAVS